jgi:hypothetical protein
MRRFARDRPPLGGFLQQTSSSAARERAQGRKAGGGRREREISIGLGDEQAVAPQRRQRRAMRRLRQDEASSGGRRRRQVARAASEPMLRCGSPQDDELIDGRSGTVPELVQRHDRGRKIVGAMRVAMNEMSKLDKQLSREAQYLQRERTRSQRSRRIVPEFRERQWNSDTNLARAELLEKPPLAEERQQQEDQARVQRREAVARLALSAELETSGGVQNAHVPRTSVPMELLFSANHQTSQDILDKAWLNKGKEEKHARLAAKLLPDASSKRTVNRSRSNAAAGVRGKKAGPRFPGDRGGTGMASAVVRH